VGIIIISYYLSFDYITQNQLAIAQLQSSQQLPPITSGEGSQKSATAQPLPPSYSQLPSQIENSLFTN
jgi:hypothetical protein